MKAPLYLLCAIQALHHSITAVNNVQRFTFMAIACLAALWHVLCGISDKKR